MAIAEDKTLTKKYKKSSINDSIKQIYRIILGQNYFFYFSKKYIPSLGEHYK